MDLNRGWQTGLHVLRLSGSTIAHHGDHLVVRSPQNPEYHWGNFVLVTDPDRVDEAEHWTDVFTRELPTARHLAVGLIAAPSAGSWRVVGAEVETDQVLATQTCPEQRPRPDGYDVRPLVTGDDWQADVRLSVRDNDRTGAQPSASYATFQRDQAEGRRQMCEAGDAAWFAAFSPDGGAVASLGIVRCGDVARYQAVMTDADHRRRGLSGHLLGVAARWAGERGCRSWVIETETDNPAGRLYRSVGFEPDVVSVSAYRAPGSR